MKKTIDIYDNFLDYHDFLNIRNFILGQQFPWYYQNTVVYGNCMERDNTDIFQFTHLFFSVDEGVVFCSNMFELLRPILNKLGAKTILKVKSNLLTKTKNPEYFQYHKDFTYPTAKTAIYYINTNNGSTIFEDGTEVQSIENRMVIFENDIMHTGKPCSDESVRVLINFNYFDY